MRWDNWCFDLLFLFFPLLIFRCIYIYLPCQHGGRKEGGGTNLGDWPHYFAAPCGGRKEGEESTWPTGRITFRPPSFLFVCGSVSSCACVVWSSGQQEGPGCKGQLEGQTKRLAGHVVRRPPSSFVVCGAVSSCTFAVLI